ncbi:MAG TPA: hypothetical protein VNB51_08625 [Candidatus Udaeobacter sp.]|nr:hypothetical protein [Candidatus Udaeobacter sp.]
MRRSVLVAFGVAIALVLGSQPARAVAPIRFSLDPVHDTQAAGVICPFRVAVDSLAINETLTILDNGRVFVTGSSVERVTNLDNGKSVVVNVSGPFTLTDADGVQTFFARGRNLWGFHRGDLGPGQPGALLLTTGLAILTQSESGSTFTHNAGTTENLCDTLR